MADDDISIWLTTAQRPLMPPRGLRLVSRA